MEKLEYYRIKKGKPLAQLPGRELEKAASPYSLPHPAERWTIEFQRVENQEDLECRGGQEVAIYTDGSKLEGKVGAAVSVWKKEREVRHRLLPLASYCSVFQAELCAIRGALEFMNREPTLKFATIYSDSRSSLECLGNPDSLHPLAVEIREQVRQLRSNGGKVEFCWIRAHVGIPGNERADELAKRAALKSKKLPVYDRFPASFAKRLIRDHTVELWQTRYSEATTGAVTRMFFPRVKEAYRTLGKLDMNNIKAQLFTGHGGFREYLHRFKLATSPYCACDDLSEETVEHILICCPRFGAERLDCEHSMDRVINKETIWEIMNDDRCRTIFLEYALKAVTRAARRNGSTV